MDKSQRAEFLEKEKETKEREAKHDVRKSSHHRRSSKLYMPKTSLGVGRGGGRGNGHGGGRGNERVLIVTASPYNGNIRNKRRILEHERLSTEAQRTFVDDER